MTRNETLLAYVAMAICLGLSGCGNKKDLGADIDMAVNGDGAIIPADVQSCYDKATLSTERSITKNALVFGNFSVRYTGKDKSLFVGSIKVTVTGGGIVNGSKDFTIASTELEALLGKRGQTINTPSDGTAVVINSNSSAKPAAFPACAMAVGPIDVTDEDSSFTATVDIKLVGSATNTLTNEVERVEEKLTGKAVF